MTTLNEMLEFVAKATSQGELDGDHTIIGGKMLLHNLMFTDEGKDQMEPAFGLPFVRRDTRLYNDMGVVCAVLAYILDHGMPEELRNFYYNNIEGIVETLETAREHAVEEMKERGFPEEVMNQMVEALTIDNDKLDEFYRPWQPDLTNQD